MMEKSKKSALIKILDILEKRTDENTLLSQSEIVDILQEKYNIKIERKAVGRNIKILQDAGYDIRYVKGGWFFGERIFMPSEIRLLIDSVLCSKYINKKHSEEIIQKLVKFGGPKFKAHVNHIYSINSWDKSENLEFLLNIELIDEAIDENKQILFDYYKMGVDKKLHKSSEQIVSPYQMMLHNQRYYLMSFNEEHKTVGFYRVDKMKNIKISEKMSTPLKSVEGYENGIDYEDLSNARPYMYSDKAEKIILECQENRVDDLIDWFGSKINIQKLEDGKIQVEVVSSLKAMEYWAMQYGLAVEIKSPQILRDRLKENYKKMIEKY